LAHPRHFPSLDRKSSSIRVCLLDCVIECDPVSACVCHEHGQNNTNYDIKVISVISAFRMLPQLKSSSLMRRVVRRMRVLSLDVYPITRQGMYRAIRVSSGKSSRSRSLSYDKTRRGS